MLTRKQAEAKGWRIVRGAYTGTTDDRADRWYIEHVRDTVVDRRGGGFYTVRDALDAIEDLEQEVAETDALFKKYSTS